MVTEAGKELLRNSINTANFHNKILEQNEMWKQWEIERGLTMMVSDDDILKKIRKNHRCSKHRKMDEAREYSRSNNNSDAVAGTSSADRWDHSGFQELYPDESNERKPSSSLKDSSKKWDHSGFHELYPDEASRDRSSSSSSSSRDYTKRLKDVSSDEEQDRPLVPSSGKKCKKKCHRYRERAFNAAKERALKMSDWEKNMRKRDEESSSDEEQFIRFMEEQFLRFKRKICKKKSYSYSHKSVYCHETERISPDYKNWERKKYNHKATKRQYFTSSSEHAEKWEHDGFLELYPELRKKSNNSNFRKERFRKA